MDATHIPVLAEEICEALAPVLTAAGQRIYVDATCGLGGHLRTIVTRFGPARAIAFDRDLDALRIAGERLGSDARSVEFVHAPFSALQAELQVLGLDQVHAIMADLGVSSMQLDSEGRGFSWRRDEPLDMRMDATQPMTAADLIASSEVGALIQILREFGEEPQAKRIARALVEHRPKTTGELAKLVEDTVPVRRDRPQRIHPATRTFQALRIAVNGELDELDALLEQAPRLLAPGGRLAIISFHSLEDRRVKRAMASLCAPPPLPHNLPVRAAEVASPLFAIPNEFRRGRIAAPSEVQANPRSRSARLRVIERLRA